MDRSHTRDGRYSRAQVLALLAAAGTLGIGACAKDNVGRDGLVEGSRSGVIDTSDFGAHAEPPPARPAPTPVRVDSKAADAKTGGTTTAAQPVARKDVFNIGGVRATGEGTPTPEVRPDVKVDPAPRLITTVGDTTPDDAAAARGVPATVDGVVGQINGRPVFVSEVLEPLDGKLRSVAADAKANPSAWYDGATKAIGDELERRIEEELVLSEVRSSLSQEQKAGLLRFLKTIESDIVSSQHGSEVEANEDAREQTGRGLYQEAEDRKDRALIGNEINSKVRPKVMVSWRDVVNEYERNAAKYNPPAVYQIRLVYTSATNTSAIEMIKAGLAAGTSFEEISHLPVNEYIPKEGGLMKRQCPNGQAECIFSPVPELNAAMQSLSVGQVKGPITYAPKKEKPDQQNVAWVYLERIDQPKGESLYDAQLGIQDRLKAERLDLEIRRYMQRLLKRGNVSNSELMREKLLAVATERYAPRFVKK